MKRDPVLRWSLKGRAHTAKWRANNLTAAREAGKVYQRQWRKDHAGEWEADLRARAQAWEKDPKNTQKILAKNRAFRKKNPDKVRMYNRKAAYGITQADYDAMVVAQGGRCKICKGTPRGKPFLLVDHDHDTGAIRGLLCQPCNVGIGHLGDDPQRLRAAAEYLRG